MIVAGVILMIVGSILILGFLGILGTILTAYLVSFAMLGADRMGHAFREATTKKPELSADAVVQRGHLKLMRGGKSQ